MSEVETKSNEKPAIEVPGAPPPPKPGPVPRDVQAAGCLHKWVSVDRFLKTGSVLQAAAAGPGVEGVLYVFFCERCLSLSTASMSLGPPRG